MTKHLSEFGDIIKGHAVYQLADGARVPGVTTITGQVGKDRLADWAATVTREGLDHRAILEESGRVGTLAHSLVRCRLLGVEPSLSHYSPNQARLAENAMRKFLDYAKRHRLEPLMLEAQLVSEAHRYGGTIDYYGLCDGEPALIDWKTGSDLHPEHRLQAAAYWNLLVENRHPVESVRVVRIGREEKGGYQEARVGDLEKRFAMFGHLLAYWYGMKEL